ncbi:MAG: hypothetical protein ACRDKB_01365 [Actinomycetota bacterium]
MRKGIAACAAVGVIAAACSNAPEPGPTAGERLPTPAPTSSERKADERGAKRAQKEMAAGRVAKKDESRTGAQRDPGAAGSDTTTKGSGKRGSAYPAAGRYRYDQSGYEEYCRATCTREDLPPTRTIDISYKRRKARRATLISDERISSRRSSETTIKVNRDAALITRAHVRFEDEGFRYENTYRPRPPIESLRFPLRIGKSWSGQWKADTSGRYEIDVVGRSTVDIGGRRVNAFRLDTVTLFSGEFEGRADVTVWIDPDTTMVVRSTGRLEIESVFGSFESEFETTLDGGPGY